MTASQSVSLQLFQDCPRDFVPLLQQWFRYMLPLLHRGFRLTGNSSPSPQGQPAATELCYLVVCLVPDVGGIC